VAEVPKGFSDRHGVEFVSGDGKVGVFVEIARDNLSFM
jgi:hypothetical protein